MARAWVCALVVAIALAGCGQPEPSQPEPSKAGPTPDRDATPSRPQPTPTLPTFNPRLDLLLQFDLVDCDGLSIAAPVPIEQIQSLLPEPYVAAPFDEPTGAAGQGTVVVDFYRCGALTTPLTTLPDTWFGHVAALIEDPLLGTPADVHEYMFEALAGEDILAQLWTVAGYSTFNGTAALDETALPGDLPIALGSRTMTAGPFTLDGYGLRVQDSTLGPSTFARYTQVEGGRLHWTGTLEIPVQAEGLGTVSMPGDSAISGMAQAGPDLSGMALSTDGLSFTGQDLWRIVEVQ